MKSNSRTKKLRDQVEVSQGVGEKGLAIDSSYHHKVGEKDHHIMVVLRLMWVKLVLCLTVNEFKKWIKTALRLMGNELQKSAAYGKAALTHFLSSTHVKLLTVWSQLLDASPVVCRGILTHLFT